ncbi:MAG: RNA-binding protein [Bacillales bacterium]|nr:RNA-binding protein [Bacillales bacterium]
MSTIYQHFRPEEKEFIDEVLESIRQVEEKYAPKLMDFLDPRQQQILSSLLGKNSEVKAAFFGGTEQAERKRGLLYPPYFSAQQEDFQVTLFEILYPKKFAVLNHRDVLGSLMGLGLRREKFGDILANKEGRFQFIAAAEMADFVKLHYRQAGKVSIELEEKKFEEAIESEESWQPVQTTVTSLRLDVMISSYAKLSRQKVQTMIKSGFVKVNWKVVDNPAFLCAEGDIISVRGKGRCKLLLIDDQTKKEKWRITLGLLK